MKRPRDDPGGAGSNKRGADGSVRGQARTREPAPAQPQSQGTQQLTQTDALSYLHDVKEHFKFEKHVYYEFLEIMKLFKNKRIDTADVICRIKKLFKGHDALILGFNTFVPRGYEIELTAEERAQGQQERERKAQAIAQANARGKELRQQDTLRAEEQLRQRAQAQPSPQQTAAQDAAKGKRPVEYEQAFTYVNKIRSRFRNDEIVYNSFLEILNMYRKEQKTISEVYTEVAKLFERHQDLLDEFIYFLPDNTAPGGGQATLAKAKAQVALKNKNAAARLAAQQGGRVPGMKQSPGDEGARMRFDEEAMRRQINKRKSARRADELIRRQTAGEMDGVEDDTMTKACNLTKELEFFDRVKARLRNREAYSDLLKCLNIFNSEMINKTELASLVYDIMGRFPDLVQGFNDLIVRCEAMDIDLSEAARAKDGRMSVKDAQEMKNVISAREKYLTRPISELDLSACERCGPSYRLLPKNFPKSSCSQRNQLCHQVLNDDWVSVTSGSEDFSFKQMRKNQYEESLFRCEDDRFELDMVIETNQATMKLLTKVDEDLKKLSTEEETRAFRLPEELLSSVHLRCVERIYGDHGNDIKDLLVRNPAVAVGVILNRLKQKDEEWRKCRDEMNIVWGEVYQKNYQKSLDHRSFYFKQMDKKALSTRGMLTEIREVSDKRKREDHGVIIACAANKRPEEPDLKFTFDSTESHNAVWDIMKFSVRECFSHTSTEQAEKLMNFWRTFMEPFFGLPLRPEEPLAEEKSEEEEEEEEEDAGGEAAAKAEAAPKEAGGEAAEPEEAPAAEAPAAPADPEPMDAEKAPAEEPAPAAGAEAGAAGAKAVPPGEPAAEAARAEGEGAARTENGAGAGEEPAAAPSAPAGESGAAAAEESPAEEAMGEAEPAPASEAKKGGEEAGEIAEEEEEEGEIGEEDMEEEEEDDEGRAEAKKDGEEGKKAGDAEEEEEEEDPEAYTGCKPLAPYSEQLEDGSLAPQPESTRIFYGNDNFYILFRLHQHLYERIGAAHTEAARVQAAQDAETPHPEKEDPPAEGEKTGVLKTFFELLYSMLASNLESAKFEDECRALLGNNAYVLFTLDKLIVKLTRHLQTLQNDDMAMKLLVLHNYEMSRSPGTFREDVYYANACVLLHDEPCYRINLDGGQELMLQLMDGGQDRDRLGLVMDTSFSTYLQDFLRSGEVRTRKGLFLNRNVQHSGENKTAMSNVHVYNGLECKISSNNCKVSYVLDTEDLFFRYKRGDRTKRAANEAATRAKREARKWRLTGQEAPPPST